MNTVNWFFVDGAVEASLPTTDRGLLYGHGLFETMCLWQGQLPLLDFHLTRLATDAKKLGLFCDVADLRAEIQGILPGLPSDGVVKLILTAGDSPRGYRFPEPTKSRRVVQFFPSSDRAALDVLQICAYRLPANPALAGVKHLNRLDQVIAAAELPLHHDGLLLDHGERVIEALSSNLFLLWQNQWLTPRLDKSGVAGVMRALLIEQVLPEMGITVTCQDIDLEMLSRAHEVFTCNAASGITPIAEVIGIGRWEDTPETASIRVKLSERYPCFGL